MTTYFDIFNIKSDLQLSNIINNLDLSPNEMFALDDIINGYAPINYKREKILEMFSGTKNYNYCKKLFLKEDMEMPSQLNMNQTIELNELFALASEKFKKVNCSQQFYQMLSQKTSKNFANAFFNMLKSIPEDSNCRFDPNLTVDGKNFAETIYPFVNELKTFLNGCKSESKKEVNENYVVGNKVQGKNNQGTYIIDSIKDGFYNLRNIYDQNRNKLYPVSKKTLDEEFKLLNEDYDADKLHKIDIQIAQLENNIKKFEQEKNSYLDEYSKLEYKLDKVRLRKLKAKREEILNESIENKLSGVYNIKNGSFKSFKDENDKLSIDDYKNRLVNYEILPDKNLCVITAWSYADAFNTRIAISKKYPEENKNIEKWKLIFFQNGDGSWDEPLKKYIEILDRESNTIKESIETQPDMFGGPDTYYKDGIEALDFDNVLDAMNKVAPEMDFVDDRDVKGKYSMIFQPKSSGLELNQKGLKKIKDYLSQKFGKENIAVRLAHSQYAPEIKKLYVTFINQIDVQNELNESLDDTLNNFKYFITSSSNKKELEYIKDKLQILFNGANDTESRNEISELLSMIDSKLNKIKPTVNECCELSNLLEPFKPTVINITVNDDGCLEDIEKENAVNQLKALASHINDKKDCCEENNLENLQTINTLLGGLVSYFNKRLCESVDRNMEDAIDTVNAQIDDFGSYDDEYIRSCCEDVAEAKGIDVKKLYYYVTNRKWSVWDKDEDYEELDEDFIHDLYNPRQRKKSENWENTSKANRDLQIWSYRNAKGMPKYSNNDIREELNDIKQDYLNNELDVYDATNAVDNLIGNKSEAEAIVDSWDDPSKHGLYGITDDEELDEMCSGGACCAGAVATVPSPVKPKSPKRKHKKSKVDEMALNMFKRQIIEDVNGQINLNGNHYEYKNGYFYINGDIARTKSKYKMLESLDENIELETLPGFNSEEMKLLEDIEASGSVGNEDDNNQNNNSNNSNNANNNNNQQNTNQNITQDNLGNVYQNVTQDNDLTPQQRQLKKDTEKTLDQSMNSGSDTEVSVNQGLDNNNDTTNNPTPNTNNIKYKVIGKDDSDSNNIKYIIQDPNSKQTMVVDATKLRLEK